MPSIVVYRASKALYVLDTGVGPEQRTVLESQIASLGEGAEEIVLVNSHGHFDHLGNNDLLQRAAIPRKRHLISKESAPDADIRAELFEMYGRGKDYFSYIDGLLCRRRRSAACSKRSAHLRSRLQRWKSLAERCASLACCPL